MGAYLAGGSSYRPRISRRSLASTTDSACPGSHSFSGTAPAGARALSSADAFAAIAVASA